jgi:DNA-binding NarL/FixJ family response regulator
MEIAAALRVTRRTAEAHVEHIRAKLMLQSRTQIAIWAIQGGISGPSSRPAGTGAARP